MSRSVSAPASAVFLFGELQGVEPRVVAAARQQLGVAALLDDAPVVHHVDDVGRDHGGEAVGDDEGGAPADQRSEEHTSELQSLMRISYAVFCLKKKKQTKSLNQSISITHKNTRSPV